MTKQSVTDADDRESHDAALAMARALIDAYQRTRPNGVRLSHLLAALSSLLSAMIIDYCDNEEDVLLMVARLAMMYGDRKSHAWTIIREEWAMRRAHVGGVQ
jgi:hypothetical protein